MTKCSMPIFPTRTNRESNDAKTEIASSELEKGQLEEILKDLRSQLDAAMVRKKAAQEASIKCHEYAIR